MKPFKYKITAKNEWDNAFPILMYIIGFSFVPLYMKYRAPNGDMDTFILYALGAAMLFLIPQTILHLTYFSINNKCEVTYHPNLLKISMAMKGEIREFHLEDIKYVFHHMSYPFAEKRRLFYPWQNYNFSRIILKDGSSFIVTSLMILRLELPVGEKYQVIKSKYFALFP